MNFHPLCVQQSQMRKRKFVVIIIIVLMIIGTIIGYVIYSQMVQSNVVKQQKETFRESKISVQPISQRDINNYKVQANYPRILIIPSLGIDARMTPLGLLASQNGSQQLDAPKNVYDTGWYDCTINPVANRRCATKKLPNDNNIAIANLVDGHSCEGYNVPCVFNKLAQIKVGAMITIEIGDGTKLNYVVREVDIVPLSQVDMEKMMKPIENGHEGLNLITCAGSWTAKDSRGRDSMNQRVEVYATK